MHTIKKGMLDIRVAKALGLKPTEVSAITAVFLQEVRDELVELNKVVLDGLGILRMSVRGGGVDSLLRRASDGDEREEVPCDLQESGALHPCVAGAGQDVERTGGQVLAVP
jgi:hypothetical protein